MPRRNLIAAILLLVLASGAAAALWLQRPERPDADAALSAPLRLPTRARFDALQRDAISACRCARGRTDEAGKQECWAEFEKAIAPYPNGEGVTMCEFSQISRCFDDGGPDDCIVVGWNPPGGPEGAICTEEEARTAEAVWVEAMENNKARPGRGTTRALEELLAKFRRGDAVQTADAGHGCTAG